MADINKDQIKVMASQRLDDTDQGGGQMTSIEIVDGNVNNLFPDISRLDRVYGRVSMRKAFLAVQTENREVYYGSHTVITKQAADPNVSVCFFSTEDWFDTRIDAKNRIESYLVQGPYYPAALWGNHYVGSRALMLHAHLDTDAPQIGDVIVLLEDEGLSSEKKQYMRVTDVSTEQKEFVYGYGQNYIKLIIYVDIGEPLEYDFTGESIYIGADYTSVTCSIYTTVAADASNYYGVAELYEDATAGELQIRVDDIYTHLVPSAQSETAITDAGIGQAVSPMITTAPAPISVVRSLAYDIRPNSKLFIGEPVKPGTVSWTGGTNFTDDGRGNLVSGASTIIGSIVYETGICHFGEPGGTYGGTGTISYEPACAPSEIAETGGIQVAINNRGFVYVYRCDPIPAPGTLKVEFLAGGKWYTMQDIGGGEIKSPTGDNSIGSGSINFLTGSITMSLGAMPDVNSMILFFWAKDVSYKDLAQSAVPATYRFTLANEGIAKGTLEIEWNGDSAVVDNSDGILYMATGGSGSWGATATELGKINYSSGDVEFTTDASQSLPVPTSLFSISYNYGPAITESFFAPPRNVNNIEFQLGTVPVIPNTVKVEWHTDLEVVELEERRTQISVTRIDPTYNEQDDGVGGIAGGTIDYATGDISFDPDRTSYYPRTTYDWVTDGIETVESDDGLQLETWEVERYQWTGIEYIQGPAIFPTEGTVTVKYQSSTGANVVNYTRTILPRYFLTTQNELELIAGSLRATVAGSHCADVGGLLISNIDGTDGTFDEVGAVNYVNRYVEINNDLFASRTINVIAASGRAAVDPQQVMVFRCPGAPVRPGSMSIRVTDGEGNIINGNSDFDGNITGDGVSGHIEYTTGVCVCSFGEFVPDDLDAQNSIWYNANLSDGAGNVWKPFSIQASTALINCVITSYLPLDPDLLGLNPVRLPIDGKVPIFRDGYIILVHQTQMQSLPNPVVADTDYTLSRTNVDLIELYDSTGKYWPDGGNYTVDLVNGIVHIEATADKTGMVEPFSALHRIEDMCLAADVQITGHISITSPLTHNYNVIDGVMVSSVLPSADLQSRAYGEFEQSSWTGVWSDDRIGSQPLASYDFVNYPITVYNKGATKERWLILFETTTRVSVIGENSGVLRENHDISVVGNNVEITNTLTGEILFTMQQAGFGTGWSAGNCIRFNTDASNFPHWFIRTTLQAPPTEPTDEYEIQIRGDSA